MGSYRARSRKNSPGDLTGIVTTFLPARIAGSLVSGCQLNAVAKSSEVSRTTLVASAGQVSTSFRCFARMDRGGAYGWVYLTSSKMPPNEYVQPIKTSPAALMDVP